jgi:hypothetical protein
LADLLITTATAQIERALKTTILLALGVRRTAATIAALRALTTQGASGSAMDDDSLVYVTSATLVYRWSVRNTTADNGTTVIEATDGGDTGRWLATESTDTAGYLKRVEFFDGTFEEAQVDQRLLGLRPCVVIHWNGADNIVSSVVAGALYKHRPEFALWCLSQSMRSGFEGQLGPLLSDEASADPGAQNIIGALKALLAGEDLDQTGIDYCEIGRERVVTTSLLERRFAVELALTVNATTHNPETDLVDLDGLDLQTEIAAKGHGADEDYADRDDNLADRDNRRVSGIETTIATGLTQDISSGSAYLAGTLVAYAGQSKAFTASRDTYRDLNDDGTLTFVVANAGDDEPAVTADALRIGVTTTDEASVTRDVILVPTIDVFGSVDTIPPE